MELRDFRGKWAIPTTPNTGIDLPAPKQHKTTNAMTEFGIPVWACAYGSAAEDKACYIDEQEIDEAYKYMHRDPRKAERVYPPTITSEEYFYNQQGMLSSE